MEKNIFSNENDSLKLILKISNRLINQSSSESLFKTLSNEMKSVFEFDRISINILESSNNTVSYFSSSIGVSPIEIEINNRPLEYASLAKYVIRNKKKLIVENLDDYNYWPSVNAMVKSGLRSTFVLPLISRGKILGSLHVSFKKSPPNMKQIVSFVEKLTSQISLTVENAIMHAQKQEQINILRKKNFYPLQQEENLYEPINFVFRSETMNNILEFAKRVANLDVPILLSGETGTGKDFLARIIHFMSNRKNNIFSKISCPTIPPSIFESEFFGHNKGAFTNASEKRIGIVEWVNNGTLFLDEIDSLPLHIQSKFLQVLEEKIIRKLGDNNTTKVNFRLISGTNTDIEEGIKKKEFRLDLYYRINIIRIHIPPLRERIDDIPILLKNITTRECKIFKCDPPMYTKSAMTPLIQYKWPGNIRELKNVIDKLIIMYSGKQVTAKEVENLLTTKKIDNQNEISNVTLMNVERNHIIRILRKANGKVSGEKGAASLLGIPRTTLQYKLKKYKINLNDFK